MLIQSPSLNDILAAFGAMTPEEKDAILAEAMADNGHMQWLPSPGPQTQAYYCEADVLLYGGQGGGGKALALDTEIPTPSGWATMGKLSPGDEVFSDTGEVCTVTATSPVMIGRPCYRVVFSDGTEIVADAEHIWRTSTRQERERMERGSVAWREVRRLKRPRRGTGKRECLSERNSQRFIQEDAPLSSALRTTEEIARTLTVRNGKEINHSVGVASALACPDAELPIDPYVLGAWLGDGSSYKGEITTADAEIIEAINAAGYGTKPRRLYAHGIYGLMVPLRELGVLVNKHIPAAYLRASAPQRLALLQGLMDTDGYADPRGQCEFTTTSEALAFGAHEVISSLGIKVTIAVGRAMLRGKDCGAKYRLKFLTDLPAFRLGRKLDRQKRDGFRATVRRRYITSVEPVASVPVRCISVSSPSRMYLASRSMIPTHNSDLGLGLAFTAQKRSLILRRQYANLSALTERAIAIHGSRAGYNGSPPPLLRTTDGRYIQFGANQHLGDEQAWQGHAFDYKYFDEACQFLEQQVRFHLGWLRSTEPGQRVRAVLGSNPPLDSTGDWLIKMFRPWLDITHPKPAQQGELRWFVTAPDGSDLELGDSTPVVLGGKTLTPSSRTFIAAALKDNPYLVNTGYQAQLDALPEPLRSAVRDGNFMAVRRDSEFQVIPTDWIVAAQARWHPDGWEDHHMTAIGFDPCGGGKDSAAIAPRHGPWYAEVSAEKGSPGDTTVGLATLMRLRRDRAPVVVDVGGGYASGIKARFSDNEITHLDFNGASSSGACALGSKLRFANARAEAWYRFREALDPTQDGGSKIALPPDPELRSDLSTPMILARVLEQRGEIQIEAKEDIRKRLGRSPDKGDAVVMCWAFGHKAVARAASGSKGRGLPSYSVNPNRNPRAIKRYERSAQGNGGGEQG